MAKKKINDDTILQLIRDGNSPDGAARVSFLTIHDSRFAIHYASQRMKIGLY